MDINATGAGSVDIKVSGDVDTISSIEEMVLSKYDDILKIGNEISAYRGDSWIDALLINPLKVDMGDSGKLMDRIDASGASESIYVNLGSGAVSEFGKWTGVSGVWWVPVVLDGVSTFDHIIVNNAEEVLGSDYSDILIGGGDHSVLHGGKENDLLWSGGKSTEMYGGAGADRFELGAGAVVKDGKSNDTTSYLGTTLFGGVQQWWSSVKTATWAPFTSLLTAYPMVGSSILMVGAALSDVETMKFVQYQKDQFGNLRTFFAWGLAGTGTVTDYDLDIVSGVGTAGVTIFKGLLNGMPDIDDIVGSIKASFTNLALRAGFGAYLGFDPLVLDLDGDGFELTSSLVSTSRFEFDNDGFAERSGWVLPDDGFLVRDANSNGKIDDLTEMFGNQTTGGFDMLGAYDSNVDGVINASDTVFASLKVWQDLNQDGETQSGELKTLAELGIVSINLTHLAPEEEINILGNVVMQVGSFSFVGGGTGDIGDVALVIDETKTRWLGDSTVSVAAAALPELMGSGIMVDLRIAMTDDATLLDMVDDLVASTPTGFDDLVADVEAILFRWAGVDSVTATALGSNGFDEQKLAFLEKFIGRALMPRDVNDDIDLVNLTEVEALWADQLPRLALRLAAQGPLADLFDGFDYDVDRELLIADSVGSVSDLLQGLIEDLPSNHGDALDQWEAWAPLLAALSESAVRSDENVLRSDFLVAQLVSAMDGITQPLSFEELVAGMGLTNVRIGTAGADALTRSSTERTVVYYGDGDDDTLTGGTGQDVYVFGREIGDTVIADQENYAGGDRIVFAFLNKDDVTLERDGNDLLITVTATDETIRVTGQFAPVVPFSSDILLSTNKGVEEIVFADGEVMSIPDIMIAVGQGTAGNDLLVGTMHSDALQGGLGNDTLQGGDDADIYVVNASEGDDVIQEIQSTPLLRAMDMLVFGDDIAPSDLVFARAGSDNGDLLITIGTGGDSLLIKDQFDYGALGFNSRYATNTRIEGFAFREYGETYTNRQIHDMLIRQATTSGKDNAIGFGDDDQFMASAGDDTLAGLDGADTYYFGTGAGHDTIDEQALYIDVDVSLSGLSFTHLADTVVFSPDIELEDLVFSRIAATNNLLITVTATGDTLTIVDQFAGVQTGPLGAQWFDRIEWFAFGDDTKISWKDVLADVTTGGSGNDTLIGDLYTDTLSGGAGNDFLSGRGYADIYVFNTGDGHDTIEDNNTSYFGSGFVVPDKTHDVLVLGPGIDTGDVTLERNGDDIDLIIGSGGDRVTLRNQNDHFHAGPLGILSNSTIEEVHFDDETVWTWEDLNERLIADATTSGDDTTEGFVFDERFEASAGNDTLIGSDGGDTYVFGVGSGHDVIRESISNILYSDEDVVEFSSGVLPGDVTLSRDGDDLILSLSKDDTLTIEGQFTYSAHFTWNDVEEFRFSNATVWTAQDVRQMLLASTSGADTLVGFGSGDTLAGGAGNDVLEGSDGSDTYVFGMGDGSDVIRENVTNSSLSDDDRLVFGAGIEVDDVTFTRDGADLVIEIDGTSDSIRIEGQFAFSNWFAWSDVETFEFDDVTLTDLDVAALLMGGTSGADSITGTFRSDLLDGREGNDTLVGGDGADRYVFGLGYGADEIQESLSNANLSEDDQLEFLPGIAAEDLEYERIGNDLKITITGTSDSVLIKGQFNNNSYFTWQDVDRFTFSDGSFITKEQVQQALLQPTSGADHQIGFISGDTLDGGAGNDTLEGVDGADTYIFGRGYGHDLIIETLTDGNLPDFDTVALAAGIDPEDITLTRDGQDLVLTLDTGETLRVQDHFDEGFNESLTYWDIDQIVFAGGTIWTKPDIAARVIHPTSGDDSIPGTWYDASVDGGAGNDTILGGGGGDTLAGGSGDDALFGGNGGDTLIGGADDDTLTGGGGNDVYRFGLGDGQDVIREFSSYFDGDGGSDTIELGVGIATTDVTITQADSGNDIVIKINGTSDQIVIEDGLTGGYLYEIETLKFADGTTWTGGELKERSAGTTSGNDTIYGSEGANSLNGAAGDDVVYGGGGNDTLTGATGADVLDGQADNDLLIGGDQNDSIYGGEGNDTLEGGSGDDFLVGQNGNDVYRFGLGGGQDYIQERGGWSWGGTDRLEFGTGITTSDVTVSQANSGLDLVLKIAGTSDQVTLWYFAYEEYRVDEVRFADSTVWNVAELITRSMVTTSGDDTIYGTSGNDTFVASNGNDRLMGREGNDVIDGGSGNDTLSGQGGNDTYLFGIGGGQDVIQDYIWGESWGGTDTVLLGSGITTSDVTIVQADNGSDLVIKINGTSDQITLDYSVNNSDFRIEQLKFNDGTIWSHADMLARAMTPTSGNDVFIASYDGESIFGGGGNDVLLGRNGADTLDGGAGNDTLAGEGSDDVYLFGIGSGNDLVAEYWGESWGGTDTIQMAAGITPDDVTISRGNGGQDYVININGATDTLTIMYGANPWSDYWVEQIRFVDTTVWAKSSFESRVIAATNGADSLTGTSGEDTLHGLNGNDTINGGDDDDLLIGDAGNDSLTGGDGFDTARFWGDKDDYTITTVGGSIQIVDDDTVAGGNDGTDTLVSIEQAQFEDDTIGLSAPIILDLDNDGVELVDLAQSHARFDFDGDGDRDRTGWFGGGDAMLVLDRDGDGAISSASEISFVDDLPGARSDLEGLAAFDENEDGVLDGNDATFAAFRLWKDDGDGVSEADELLTLEQAGISGIRLAGTAVDQAWAWGSNIVVNTGGFVRSDGSGGAFADVALSYRMDEATPEQAFSPPPAWGYGAGLMEVNVAFC
jgi:Ca2+-binding RTX toxin-like protein